jgi:ADP-heptose:LPS heptosyltransferase
MKVLVRLPNWLGDMVMSVGFIHQLSAVYPGAEVSVIARKGLHDLLRFFPPMHHQFVFDRAEYGGFKGQRAFGKLIAEKESFDLFFSLPDSFSSALIGYTSGAPKRAGFKKELREMLLTHTYKKPKGLHRVEEYGKLLELYSGTVPPSAEVVFRHTIPKEDYVVVNINSEASSRRLTIDKAAEQITAVRQILDKKIFLIGAAKEQPFVETVLGRMADTSGIESIAGKTSLAELCQVLAGARLLLTTDSGPAHLANALGTDTVVLFGAGNETNTAPYRKDLRTVIRLGQLSCEPCTKNVCVRFGLPECLERLDVSTIAATVNQRLQHGTGVF